MMGGGLAEVRAERDGENAPASRQTRKVDGNERFR
jgi:hypothetical protein